MKGRADRQHTQTSEVSVHQEYYGSTQVQTLNLAFLAVYSAVPGAVPKYRVN